MIKYLLILLCLLLGGCDITNVITSPEGEIVEVQAASDGVFAKIKWEYNRNGYVGSVLLWVKASDTCRVGQHVMIK